jgi:predicted nucleic acid-binding protein
MCLVIDTNVFGSVFNEAAKEHKRFAPVINWLTNGKGRLIYGGDKYNSELKGSSYTRIFAELSRGGKLIRMPTGQVNTYAAQLKVMVRDRDFDDEHIVALVAISRCCVVCTDDKRSFSYLKRRDLYPAGMKPPKIYGSARNADLCCDKHIVDVCR